jgi:hypothetical protein
MFRGIFDQVEEGFYGHLRNFEHSPVPVASLGETSIFSSITSALSKAYDSARETVIEATDKVVDTVSDAYDATVDTVSSAADIVADAYESTRDVVSDVADKVADVASDAYTATADAISTAAENVTETATDAFEASQEYVSDLGTKIKNDDGSLNYWAVAGGAVIGVGAIAAVPFTGGGSLLGAATLAGSLAGGGAVAAAVGAGVAGAVIGAHLGDDTASRQRHVDDGYAKGKAENAVAVNELRNKLERIFEELKSAGKFFDGVVAMQAVAIAAANCDGEICESEKNDIEMFISGLSASNLPASVIAQITSLYEKPPSLRDAFAMAADSGMEMSMFDDIINLVVQSDGVVRVEEDAFMQAWNELKAA